MGIRQHKDGYYYIECDFDDCKNKVKLNAKDFWEASSEAKKLGWRLRKTQYGSWVNFCTGFCEICYFAPQKKIRIKKKQAESIATTSDS